MSTYKISVAELFTQAFGRSGYRIDPSSVGRDAALSAVNFYVIDEATKQRAEENKYTVGQSPYAYAYAAGDVDGEGTSPLGLPVYQAISFTSVDQNSSRYDMGDALVTVTAPRTLARTGMQGQDEDVIEFISNKNFDVLIQGFLYSSNPYQQPFDQIGLFNKWFRNKKESLGVIGKVFDSFGIHNLVVENYKIGAIPGMMNIRPFELHCVSDKDYSLQIMES